MGAAMSAVAVGQALTVLLCDDRTLRRECLARVLELRGICVRVIAWETALTDYGRAESGAGSPNPILEPPDETVDLAIVDIGDKSCSDVPVKKFFDHLRRVAPRALMVVVSDREDGSAVVDAMELGARAYFPSSLALNILIETLRFVQNGGTFVPPSALMNGHGYHKSPQSAEPHVMGAFGITERELRVLELLQRGQSNKAIARELAIEEGTVKVHVHRILKKLHAHNRTEAALLARNLVSQPENETVVEPLSAI